MKYLFALTLSLIAITATAQSSRTYEASLEHVSVAYNYTPDDILYSSLSVGHKLNTYASASISVRPLVIKSKISEFMSLEPFVFFEYGYDGSTFINYGVGATHKINDKLSISGKYSQWGIAASITFH